MATIGPSINNNEGMGLFETYVATGEDFNFNFFLGAVPQYIYNDVFTPSVPYVPP